MGDAVQEGDVARGHPSQVETTIKRKVSALASWNSKIYIGKTSGPYGLAERFNNTYKGRDFDAIVPVYETSSADYADQVEIIAIDHAREKCPAKLGNENRGGGGPDGVGTPKIVYVATKI